MSVPLWVVVCVVIPSGIGAVLYFLLRLPVLSMCPACNARIEADYHFCPQCAYQVAPCCGNCHRTTRMTDLHCVYCGHPLAADHPPARLHAFAE
jgi:predicted amidophosphoribosyltransferase